MASLVVRGLDQHVKDSLARQARENGRSMEAEVRDILTRAVRAPDVGRALLAVAERLDEGVELPIPPRGDTARSVDFS